MFYESLSTRYRFWFYFFARCVLGGNIWVLGDPNFPANKQTTNKKIVNGLAGAHRTLVQTIRIEYVYLPSTAWTFIWTSVRKTCVICVVPRNYLVLVQDQLWALNMTWYWPHAVRFVASNFLQTCLGVLVIGSFRKTKCFLFYGSAWPLLACLKACGRWGHAFGASPVLGPERRKCVCHPFPWFMTVSKILNMWHSKNYCMRHSWRTQSGTISLNQLVFPSESRKKIPHLFDSYTWMMQCIIPGIT